MTSSVTVSNGKGGFSCFWTIQNFLNITKNSNLSLESETFKTKMFQNSIWYLKFTQSDEKFLQLYLFREKGPLYVSITYSYFFLTVFGWMPMYENLKYSFKRNGAGCGIASLIALTELQNKNFLYLPNGALTIGVHMYNKNVLTLSSQCSMVSILNKKNNLSHLSNLEYCIDMPNNLSIFSFSSPTQELFPQKLDRVVESKCTQTDKVEDDNIFEDLEDLLHLFKEKKFQYVILRCKEKEFAAHKALLCARSPVFNAMFDKDMKENSRNIVDIDDIDGSTLSLLLLFVHLEPLPNLEWDEAINLYYAADKYQVEILKDKCSSILKENLSTDNVCEALLISDIHQDTDLGHNALQYFIKNSKIVLRSTKWKEFMKSNIDFASEILSELAEQI